jgi:hypothetical protein
MTAFANLFARNRLGGAARCHALYQRRAVFQGQESDPGCYSTRYATLVASLPNFCALSQLAKQCCQFNGETPAPMGIVR